MGKKQGQIQVTVQTGERLAAITELAQAINKLATALAANVSVGITGCTFSKTDTGVAIDTQPDVTETLIQTVD